MFYYYDVKLLTKVIYYRSLLNLEVPRFLVVLLDVP